MKLHLVCDVSGSMGEGGRAFTMRTSVLAVTQWVLFGYANAEINLYGWATEIRQFPNWTTKDEFPEELLSCGGSPSANSLIRWFGKKPDGKVLLLTDGFWTWAETKALKNWMDCLPLDTLRVIKIGAGANPQLKGPNVFHAEEVYLALDYWLKGDLAG